jgi:WD40 repeat protein
VSTGRERGVFIWNGEDIGALAFSPDGRWLATGDYDGRVRLWPVPALLDAGSDQ